MGTPDNWILNNVGQYNKNKRKCGKLGWGISRPPQPLGIQSLGNCAPNFNQKM